MPRFSPFNNSVSRKEVDYAPKNIFRSAIRSDSPSEVSVDSRGSRRRNVLEREHASDGKNRATRGVFRTCSERGSLSRKRARPGKFCPYCRPTLASRFDRDSFGRMEISPVAIVVAKDDAKGDF
jgi:hypothetical protein